MDITQEGQQSSSLYIKLDESKAQTRLVTIEKASGPDALDIRCRLSVVSMNNNPSYTALSYVWGDPGMREPIIVNGIPLSVTTNLADALYHLYERYKEKRVSFWIDAICINQDDLSERGSQVNMMGDIYSRAEIVLAWLGKADEDSSKLFSLINTETGNIDANRNWTEIEQSSKAIKNVFERPYWLRMWTQQEGFLARNLLFVCGPHSTPGQNLLKFATACYHLQKVVHKHRNLDPSTLWKITHALITMKNCRMIIFRRSFRPGQSAPNLNHLLLLTKDCESNDPRDMLYALHGIDRNNELCINPDYKKDVPRVYAEFIQQVVRKNSLLVLNGSNGIGTESVNHKRILGLPSWTPDFTRKHQSLCDQFQPWNMPIDPKPETGFSMDGLALTAKGLFIDKVKQYELEEMEDLFRKRWWALACQGGQESTYPTGIPRIQAYFRTLLLFHPGAGHSDDDDFFQLAVGFMMSMMLLREEDMGPSPKFGEFCQLLKQQFNVTEAQIREALTKHGWHVYAFIQITGALDHLTAACVKASGLEGITDMSEQTLLEGFCGPESDPHHLKWVRKFDVPEMNSEFYMRFMSHIHFDFTHRAFFTTPKGYMGLGPKGIQEGDLVSVLFGCQQTLLLRPVEDYYLVVGSCYVNGISGESMARLRESGDFEEHRFELR
ncbi:heterokaryon incompatibility protein-domain-containing protein [Hypoxylon rubiginosum]|uniref:Heterokaryon incompatibility protein-domain-containing protein n=1 Tax=Hypoxylon rubiginosum TaxID=110542 RepID=A0ACC0CX96_9PEZI|nr:heterokaryon incompatibility protein-domain-containing protein [Hypoxylon rubiginosum]